MDLNLKEIDDNKKYVFAVYILQALGFVTGGLTAVVGLIVNYIKDGDIQGGPYESHFRWQKRTFWFGLLWTLLGSLTLVFVVGYVVLTVTTFWLIYRIAKGWIYLVDGKQLYVGQ